MKTKITWILRLIASIIMLQTLYYKFSAAPESVYIFTKMGVEPFGRIGAGIAELIASLLILYPKYTRFGAILGIFIMFGAIFSHIFVLGIEIMNDGGKLFGLAVAVLISCLLLIIPKNVNS